MKDGKLPANEAQRLIQHESSSRSVNLSGGTPAVALTAYAKAEDPVRAFRAGFQIHVPKPVEPAELVPDIANHAGRSIRT